MFQNHQPVIIPFTHVLPFNLANITVTPKKEAVSMVEFDTLQTTNQCPQSFWIIRTESLANLMP